MNLFLDTETSGLRRDTLAPDDPAQPHLLQLAVKLVDEDGTRRGRYTAIIKPEGWSIEPEAAAVHGISERMAHRCGVPVVSALVALRGLAEKARTVVGHNVQFDRAIITLALKRAGSAGAWFENGLKFECTMEMSTPILKLKGEYGDKFPTLEEAYEYFLRQRDGDGFMIGERWTSRHDAEDDLEKMQAVYQKMRS